MAFDIKLTYVQLEFLAWLTEVPLGKRVMSTSDHSSYFFEEVEVEGGIDMRRIYPAPDNRQEDQKRAEDELSRRFQGRMRIDTTPLYRVGFLKSYHSLGLSTYNQGQGMVDYKKLVSRYVRDPFSYRESVKVPTEAALEYMQQHGWKRLEALREERKARLAEVHRTVLIGKMVVIKPKLPRELVDQYPEGFPLPLPTRKIVRPFATAVVTKETPQRLYLDQVTELKIRSDSYISSPISGYAPNQYISHDDVMLDHVSPDQVRRLVQVDSDYLDDVDRIGQQEIERLLPQFLSMADRLRQKAAEYEDMLRDAMEAEEEKPDFKP